MCFQFNILLHYQTTPSSPRLFSILITRITTFIKAKLKISDDMTNIDKHRAANITKYNVNEIVQNQHFIMDVWTFWSEL